MNQIKLINAFCHLQEGIIYKYEEQTSIPGNDLDISLMLTVRSHIAPPCYLHVYLNDLNKILFQPNNTYGSTFALHTPTFKAD